jgi:hypothetical protein
MRTAATICIALITTVGSAPTTAAANQVDRVLKGSSARRLKADVTAMTKQASTADANALKNLLAVSVQGVLEEIMNPTMNTIQEAEGDVQSLNETNVEDLNELISLVKDADEILNPPEDVSELSELMQEEDPEVVEAKVSVMLEAVPADQMTNLVSVVKSSPVAIAGYSYGQGGDLVTCLGLLIFLLFKFLIILGDIFKFFTYIIGKRFFVAICKRIVLIQAGAPMQYVIKLGSCSQEFSEIADNAAGHCEEIFDKLDVNSNGVIQFTDLMEIAVNHKCSTSKLPTARPTGAPTSKSGKLPTARPTGAPTSSKAAKMNMATSLNEVVDGSDKTTSATTIALATIGSVALTVLIFVVLSRKKRQIRNKTLSVSPHHGNGENELKNEGDVDNLDSASTFYSNEINVGGNPVEVLNEINEYWGRKSLKSDRSLKKPDAFVSAA